MPSRPLASVDQGASARLALLALIAAGFALTVTVFYPGVMTWDAVYVRQAAIEGAHGDWQSPLMSVVWGWIDPLAPGATSMFLLTAFLYWAGFAVLAFAIAGTRPWLALVVPLLALSPPAFVIVGVIWRDVLFAALWLLAAALAFAGAGRRASARLPLQAVALVLFAAGVLVRPNALIAAPILGVYLLWPARFSLKRAVIAYVPMALALFGLVQVVYYDLIGAERQHPLHSLFVYDLAGTTHFSGVNQFPVTWTAEQERLLTTSCYDPTLWDVYWNREPCKFVMERLEQQDHLFGTPALPRAWLAAITRAPLAYVAHRSSFFRAFLVGDNLVGWFHDVTAPGRLLRADDRVFMTYKAAHDALKAATPLFRMGVWLTGCLFLIALAWRRRDTPAGAFAVAVPASGAVFVLTYWPVGVAADYRYGYWAVLACLAAAAALAVRPGSAPRAGSWGFRAGADSFSVFRNGLHRLTLALCALHAPRATIPISTTTRGPPIMATTRQDDKITQSAETVRRTAEEARRAGEEATRKTAEDAAQFGRSALDAGERVTRTGTELMQQNADIMRRAWQSYLQIAAQMTGRSGNEFGGLFGVGGDEARAAAEQSSRNVEAIVDSGSVIAKGVEDISREWFDFARGRIEHNLSQVSELARCRTPQQVAAVQSELMRDNLEVLLQISRKVAEISARVAEDATGRMKDGVEKAKRAA